jgi:hypothetical protein
LLAALLFNRSLPSTARGRSDDPIQTGDEAGLLSSPTSSLPVINTGAAV